MANELVSAEVIAENFGVTIETVLRWARDKVIPSYRPSWRVIRFKVDEVERSLSAQSSKVSGTTKHPHRSGRPVS